MYPNPPSPSQSPDAGFEVVSFFDRDAARLTFDRVSRRLSPQIRKLLPSLLADVPDPDFALLQFSRLVERGDPTLREIENHPSLAHYALAVFGHSRFLAETLLHNPDLLPTFLKQSVLDRSLSREEFHENLARFRSRSFDTDPSVLLARFKRRQYIRILLRDVLQLAPLAETTCEISALSDVLIEEALREAEAELQGRLGLPQHIDPDGRVVPTPFTILSLGKLGGDELNYSSDVDLMFVFGDGHDLPESPATQREFFVRLAQKLIEILSHPTPQGPVFRIDLRLRPQGNEGELAVSLTQALRYYAESAADWELQALIKVRHSAGSASLARDFIRAVRPYVYTEQLNFAAVKTALVARERMQSRRQKALNSSGAEPLIDVKLGPGGIRDIEFLVQCLQRVYGGGEPWVRSGGTLFSLQKLYDNRHISGRDFHELTSAYEFLRHLEHRLQLRDGRQTHCLPSDKIELAIVCRSMSGYLAESKSVDEFVSTVCQRMSAVAEIYQRVVYQQQGRTVSPPHEGEFQLKSGWGALGEPSARQILGRLANDSPSLYKMAVRDDLSSGVRAHLFRFLSAAFSSSDRYAVLLQQAGSLERALIIFEFSDYLTHVLICHPEEIATLSELGEIPARVGSGYLFDSPLGEVRPKDSVLEFISSAKADFAESQSLLRRQFRHRAFAAGAKEVIFHRPLFESLGETTAAAEDAVRAAYGIAGSPGELAILALGRLGSNEFDLLSDADLLFVCEHEHSADVQKSVEQIIQALAAYTQEGTVFSVDTRLRPHGHEGELLVNPALLRSYFREEAQAWEALTFTKLRFLTGSRRVGDAALTATQGLFERFAVDPGFLGSVLEMRSRLESAEPSLKTSPGGVYDIDFLCSYLLVKNAIPEKGGTLRDRLWRCAEAGLLSKSHTGKLDHAAELFRTVEHVMRLVLGRPQKWLPAGERVRYATEKLTTEILGWHFPSGLEAELIANLRMVREIYIRELGTPPG